MFNSYEELKEKFPIGTVYRKTARKYKECCYDSNDINYMKNYYDSYVKTEDNLYICTKIHEYKVDGYLFDGTDWYPAKQTWDGWEPIDEDEINVEVNDVL